MRTEKKKTCICSTDVFSEKKTTRQARLCVFGKKDNLLHWWACSLSPIYCLSNIMKEEFAGCKQRWDVRGLREVKIKYETGAWIWWTARLCYAPCLRMEVRLASSAVLLLATLGFSWTFFRAAGCSFKLLYRRGLKKRSPRELPAQRWC